MKCTKRSFHAYPLGESTEHTLNHTRKALFTTENKNRKLVVKWKTFEMPQLPQLLMLIVTCHRSPRNGEGGKYSSGKLCKRYYGKRGERRKGSERGYGKRYGAPERPNIANVIRALNPIKKRRAESLTARPFNSDPSVGSYIVSSGMVASRTTYRTKPPLGESHTKMPPYSKITPPSKMTLRVSPPLRGGPSGITSRMCGCGCRVR